MISPTLPWLRPQQLFLWSLPLPSLYQPGGLCISVPLILFLCLSHGQILLIIKVSAKKSHLYCGFSQTPPLKWSLKLSPNQSLSFFSLFFYLICFQEYYPLIYSFLFYLLSIFLLISHICSMRTETFLVHCIFCTYNAKTDTSYLLNGWMNKLVNIHL